MNVTANFLTFWLAISILSCDKTSVNRETKTCLRARYVSEYCPSAKPLHLVEFMEPTEFATKQQSQIPDSVHYMAAVLDLPESVQKHDTIFYLKFHFDRKAEKKYSPKICQSLFSIVKILVCEQVSKDPCAPL